MLYALKSREDDHLFPLTTKQKHTKWEIFGGFSKKEEYCPCGHDSNSRKNHGREMQGEAQGDLHRRLAGAGRRHPCQGHCIDHLGRLDVRNGQD